jgi:hypothetical protein
MTALATLGDLLYWSYANLAMASAAETRGIAKYDTLSWMIRGKLYKGLRDGTMNVGSLFRDVRDLATDRCVYCAAEPPPKLHADHLIPRSRGGPESGDNLVWACAPCNQRKHARDVLEWHASQGRFPPLAVMRRYLKLALAEAREQGLMERDLDERPAVNFSLEHVPTQYPQPGELRWAANEMTRPIEVLLPVGSPRLQKVRMKT